MFLIITSKQCSLVVQKQKRRKYPPREYFTSAPAVKAEYNKFKCKVDQWNKALLNYWNITKFTKENISYTQFFFHAFTLQAFTFYNANTNANISQLDFRLAILDALYHIRNSTKNQLLVPRLTICWPQPIKGSVKKCQFCRPASNCSTYCANCDKWGCLKCLTDYHMSLQ